MDGRLADHGLLQPGRLQPRYHFEGIAITACDVDRRDVDASTCIGAAAGTQIGKRTLPHLGRVLGPIAQQRTQEMQPFVG